MALSTAATLGLLAAATVASGVGTGIAASSSADAARDAAKESALGPVRGGTSRAGNAGDFSPMDSSPESIMARIGQATAPARTPVYGQSGGPIDLTKLTSPSKFGTGFNVGKYKLNV